MNPAQALNVLAQAAALAPMPLANHQQVHAAVQVLSALVQKVADRQQKKTEPKKDRHEPNRS